MGHKEEENNLDFFEIDFFYYIKVLFNKKLKIFFITCIFAVISIFYALSLKNQFVSYSILLPNTEGSSISSLARQYSGLASIAGIDLSSPGGALSSSELAEEQIKQLTFFEEHIYEEIVVELMAGHEWDKETDTLKIDETLYDSNLGKWVRDVQWPLTVKPSAQEAHIAFKSHVTTELDKKNKLTIYVEHFHPKTTKKWAELVIEALKNASKERNINDAKKSIDFFKKEYEVTEIAELKRIISNLLGDSIQKLAVSSIEGDNLFLVLQKPFVPLIKDSPQRSTICAAITILGFLLACFYFLIKDFFQEKNLTLRSLLDSLSIEET